MWGNDPTLNQASYDQGKRPVEGIVSASCPAYACDHLGWLGRINGPVDNPVSACLSCHSTAENPASAPLTVSSVCTDDEKLAWFRNLGGDLPFGIVQSNSCDVRTGATWVALDYSLQMRVALANVTSGKWINPCEPTAGRQRIKRCPLGPTAMFLRALSVPTIPVYPTFR
jgi:hypothetical protein